MEQDFLVFDEEDRKKKTRQEKHLFWERWLLSKGFTKHHDSYFTKSIYEYGLDENMYYTGRREIAEICVEMIVTIYSVWLRFNKECLFYSKGYIGTEIYGDFKTIDVVANAMKEYLDLRDELIKLQEQVGDE